MSDKPTNRWDRIGRAVGLFMLALIIAMTCYFMTREPEGVPSLPGPPIGLENPKPTTTQV